jgi:phosphoglycolate phosphatase
MLTLFWDIDGTLLTTAGAGMAAWRHAATEVAGTPVDLSGLSTRGLTDIQVAQTIGRCVAAGVDVWDETALIRCYEARLAVDLPKGSGHVLPGVRDILDALRTRDDVALLLLTGNTRAGAATKLALYGLAEYFVGGAFCDGTRDRSHVARNAVGVARGLFGDRFSSSRAIVIGDTPHDIRCAAAIGVRALAVASNAYSVSDLAFHAPWCVIDRLPSPDDFAALVGLPARPTAVELTA